MIDSVIFTQKINKEEATIEEKKWPSYFLHQCTDWNRVVKGMEQEQDKVSGLNWLFFDADLQVFLNKLT